MSWVIYLALIVLVIHAVHVGKRLETQSYRLDVQQKLIESLLRENEILKMSFKILRPKEKSVVDAEWKVVYPSE